jgi:hypothetical protein
MSGLKSLVSNIRVWDVTEFDYTQLETLHPNVIKYMICHSGFPLQISLCHKTLVARRIGYAVW